MIASLPMYDRPETAAANDRLWTEVRDRLRAAGVDAPDALTRAGDPHDHWADPDLVLSQTCGMPFRMGLHRSVQLVATPVGTVPGIAPGMYCSVLVVRADDSRDRLAAFAGARLAYNAPDSQSGWAAMASMMRAEGIAFGEYLRSGAHRAAARMVARGQADIAALDVLSWTLMRRWDDFADRLRVLAQTPATPALPYICGHRQDPALLRRALGDGIRALSPADRDLLGIAGLTEIPAQDYLAVTTPAPPPA